MTHDTHGGLMAAASDDRVGVLVVRVWLEGPDPQDLRARITAVTDLGGRSGQPQSVVVATADAACRVVLAFIEEFIELNGAGEAESPGDGMVTPG